MTLGMQIAPDWDDRGHLEDQELKRLTQESEDEIFDASMGELADWFHEESEDREYVEDLVFITNERSINRNVADLDKADEIFCMSVQKFYDWLKSTGYFSAASELEKLILKTAQEKADMEMLQLKIDLH